MVILMSDEPELDGPTSFVRWLHAQVKGDPARMMPYALIYNWGRHIHAILGSDGQYNAEWVALELSQQGATADDLAALASAEAAWRVDSLVDSAELAGVSLDPSDGAGNQETGGDIVSPSVSQAVEAAEARVLCGYRNHRGEGCVETAVAGAGRCGRHGGAITDPEVRRSFLLVAFAKVIDGSRVAVDALLDVAENGRSEMARVQAAKELLDRAGVQQDQHVHIHRPEEDASEDDVLDDLRRRLHTATDRLRIHALPVTSEDTTNQLSLPVVTEQFARDAVPVSRSNSDDDIVDATIVDDGV
jgi:hypothetical protein